MKDNYIAQGLHKLFIVPQDPIEFDKILAIDRKSKETLRLRHHVYMNSDFEINTIATVMIESMITAIYGDSNKSGIRSVLAMKETGINFYDLVEMGISLRRNESAEKLGNINIMFEPGTDAIKLISEDVAKEEDYISIGAAYTYLDDGDRTLIMKKFDAIAKKILSEQYSIIISSEFAATAATYIFIENLYKFLLEKATVDGSSMVNFNDIIEFHCVVDADKNANFYLRPGMGAKLIVKSDRLTEVEED